MYLERYLSVLNKTGVPSFHLINKFHGSDFTYIISARIFLYSIICSICFATIVLFLIIVRRGVALERLSYGCESVERMISSLIKDRISHRQNTRSGSFERNLRDTFEAGSIHDILLRADPFR